MNSSSIDRLIVEAVRVVGRGMVKESTRSIKGEHAYDLTKAFGKVVAGDKVIVNFKYQSGNSSKMSFMINQVVSNVELKVTCFSSPVHRTEMVIKLENGVCTAYRA